MRLLNVDTRELVGFKDKLICHFILVADMLGGGIREFMNDKDVTDMSQVDVAFFPSF